MSTEPFARLEVVCHFCIYKGRSKTGSVASLVYVGLEEGLVYIAPFVAQCFFEHSISEREGILEWSELDDFIAHQQTEICLLLAPKELVRHCHRSGDILGVSRIHQKVDVSSGWEHTIRQLSNRENKRRVQLIGQGFDFDVSHDEGDFLVFYRSMHVPTMQTRYGCHARSVPEEKAYLDLFKRGVLFRISLKGEWVAGSVSQIDGATRTLNARLIGVKNGATIYRSNGAQNYVYHSILEWASGQPSIDCVDFQGCEPFLSKGTFQYKKRFGAMAVIPENAFGAWRLLIRAKMESSSVRQFLINNPLIGVDGAGHLQAQYFFDSQHKARLDIPCASKGIASEILHNLDQWHV
ncbi:hypothetical protein [Pseudomonas sp. Ant30-3]|uniref:hypothetical protein n=1 Tax=Pseudomonas sp. Ant30-3 TaxID=1488328 RepID=UPI00048C890B|nr:hypothetical protein [Pseudomonas sp. Ant30-3]